VDGIPGGLLHQASIPDFEHFGWRLPKLATVMVTKGLVVLPKAVWDVTVWRPVAYIQVLTVLELVFLEKIIQYYIIREELTYILDVLLER
jgi:hypothetical protein